MEVAKSENFVNTIQTQEKEIEQRLRDVLENDPNDFDTWLELVKHIETYDSLENNQAVYQEILDIYPQCFGFWRKLADIYNVQKQIKQVIDTYEQGLKYLPVCVELWMPYCTWKAENFPFMEAEALYERAVEACGKVYNSSVLWDRFLDFEKRNFQYEKMGDIFWRLVQIPTNKLYEYYTRFRSFINSPGRKLEHYGISLPERDPAESDIDFATRCEDLRKARLDQILSTYDTTVIENNKRKQFETRIKRSFFHVKPLEETQLQNWREYLEFEEKEGSDARVVLLYERAIVATCYYPEFWVRYANYIEHTLDDSAARVLYELAIERFLTSRPDGYIAQAVFEETHGNLDKARSLYKAVYEQVTPGLLEGIFGHLHLERRAENFEIVETLYQQAFEVASGQEEVYVYVTWSYVRYLIHSQNNLENGLGQYVSALEKYPSNKTLHLSYIQALSYTTDKETRLNATKAAYLSALDSISKEDHAGVWVAYMDFMREQWPNTEDYYALERESRCETYQVNSVGKQYRQLSYPKPSKKFKPN